MKKIFFILFCISSHLFSQVSTFQNTYGTSSYEAGKSLIETADHGFVFIGKKNSQNQIVKTDNLGAVQWSMVYSTTLSGIVQSSDGGYMVCGGPIVSKLNSAGGYVWTKDYTNVNSFNSIKKTLDNGYILAGTYSYADVLIMKIDSMGAVQWSQKIGFGSPYDEFGYDAVQLPIDSSYIVIGHGSNSGPLLTGTPTQTIIVTRFSKNGTMIWNKCIPYLSGTYEQCYEVYNIILESSGKVLINSTWNSLMLIEMDSTGAVLSSKRFPNVIGNFESLSSLYKTADGGVLLSGQSMDTNGENIRVIKLDPSLNVLWHRQMGGPKNDVPFSVMETSDGGIAIGATTFNFSAGESDLYLIKSDSLLTLGCNTIASSLSPSASTVTSINFTGPVAIAPISTLAQFPTDAVVSIPSHDACTCVPPVANFVSSNGDFTDHSTWGTNWHWDFGDGTVDSVHTNPVHNYSANGTYYACLTLSNACGSDSFCDSASYIFFPVSVEENLTDISVTVYPNPAHGVVSVESATKIKTIEIYNVVGDLIRKERLESKKGEIVITDLAKGVYFLKLNSDNSSLTKKLIIE